MNFKINQLSKTHITTMMNIFDCLKDELNIVKEIISSSMQSAYK